MPAANELQISLPEAEGFNDLAAYATILRRRWLPATLVCLSVIAGAIMLASRQTSPYVAKGTLLVRKRDPALSLLAPSGAFRTAGEVESLTNQNTPIDTEIQILKSAPLIQGVIDKLKLKDGSGKPLTPDAILSSLEVKSSAGVDTLDVSYQSSNPKVAAAFVNQLFKVYIERNIQVNRSEASAARKFISQKLPEVARELQQTEDTLRLFQEKNKVVNIQAETESAVRMLSDLDQRITQTGTTLAGTESQIQALQDKLGLPEQQAIALNAVSESKAVQEALVEYEKVLRELTLRRATYTESSPTVTLLMRQERSMRALLQSRVEQVLGIPNAQVGKFQIDALTARVLQELVTSTVTRDSLSRQLETLVDIRDSYQQRANGMPRLAQIQRQLERKVQLHQSNYQTLVGRQQEVLIAENQNLGNIRILSPATQPSKPVASKKKLLLPVAGFVGGGLLGLMTALFLDLLDSSVHTVKDIRDRFHYPLLGLIPVAKTRPHLQRFGESVIAPLTVRDEPSSLVSEAYRIIQAKLKFLSPDSTLKSIAITSFVPREGKSTVAANLAIALSQLGHNVLLIDANLRYPEQHRMWELGQVQGLTDLIIGQVEMSKALYNVLPNLTVLPAGSLAPNPLTLLDSDRMRFLIRQFEQQFDFVLFDTSPLMIVADTLPLGRATDGLILVARPGTLDVSSAHSGQELLTQSAQSVLGLVINGVQSSRESKNYFSQADNYRQTRSDRSQLNSRKLLNVVGAELKNPEFTNYFSQPDRYQQNNGTDPKPPEEGKR